VKILIVDDTPSVLESLRGALELRGHVVLEATTSQDAASVIRDTAIIDVIITDWDLGPLSIGDGTDVMRVAKSGGVPRGCIWSALTRPPCEGADLQLTKDKFSELLDWVQA
jgi:CheY-like chemotaxis protein